MKANMSLSKASECGEEEGKKKDVIKRGKRIWGLADKEEMHKIMGVPIICQIMKI